MDSIHDMRVVNIDAVSYQSQTLEKCLETAERNKNKNHHHACLNERRNFTPLSVSVDGLLGVEAETMLKCIASRLTQSGRSRSHVPAGT